MEQTPRRPVRPPPPEPQGLTIFVMRAWMWLVPIAIIIAALVFGAVAALDGRWALFGVMLVMLTIGVGLLFLHWWLLYRFGSQPRTGD